MRGSPVNRLEDVWPQIGEPEEPLRESAFWKSKARRLENDAESFIEEHPQLALAAAAALGLVLGWVVKRR